MVLPYKWFRFPFAVAGDLTAVPDTVQPDGSISYNQGYGPDYQLDPATQPAALNIERQKFNQVMNDVTTFAQFIQTGQIPVWLAAADNGGVAVSYSLGAVARYATDGLVYQSVSAANTATPGTDITKWWPIWPNNVWADTGAANAYVVTMAPALPAYVTGMQIRFKPANGNTGPSTININGLGAKNIRRGNTNLLFPGDLSSSLTYTLEYNGTIFLIKELTSIGYIGAGNIPNIIIPDDGSFHTILDLTTVTNSGLADLTVTASGPSSKSWSGNILAQQFASGNGPGNTPISNPTVQNGPGAVTFQVSGQLVQMAITGGVGNYTITTRVKNS